MTYDSCTMQGGSSLLILGATLIRLVKEVGILMEIVWQLVGEAARAGLLERRDFPLATDCQDSESHTYHCAFPWQRA